MDFLTLHPNTWKNNIQYLDEYKKENFLSG
jgi:hypothetical protein